MQSIELIHFGNELLIGEILNTNAQWLADRFTKLGFQVTRITTLPDDLQSIEQGFKDAFNRQPTVIICTGGLGPTWDDQTLAGLANALNEPLAENQDALQLIKDRYYSRNIDLNAAGRKMALFPKSAQPLKNALGTAPGTTVTLGQTRIYALPGIPREMKGIVDAIIIPQLLEAFPSPDTSFFEDKFYVEDVGESRFAHLTERLTNQHPEIYIKSHPKQHRVMFHITAYGDTTTQDLLLEVSNDLQKSLIILGATITPISSSDN